MTPDTEFARKLIEEPGDAATDALFDGKHPGIFWVDWREADDWIVKLANDALGGDELRGGWVDGKLHIAFRGRDAVAPLEGRAGEQDLTLETLNRVLAPDYEIRYVRASEGGDTLAFLVLGAPAWRELEAQHGTQVDAAFARVSSASPLFEG